jgi:hypothetical protein
VADGCRFGDLYEYLCTASTIPATSQQPPATSQQPPAATSSHQQPPATTNEINSRTAKQQNTMAVDLVTIIIIPLAVLSVIELGLTAFGKASRPSL